MDNTYNKIIKIAKEIFAEVNELDESNLYNPNQIISEQIIESLEYEGISLEIEFDEEYNIYEEEDKIILGFSIELETNVERGEIIFDYSDSHLAVSISFLKYFYQKTFFNLNKDNIETFIYDSLQEIEINLEDN